MFPGLFNSSGKMLAINNRKLFGGRGCSHLVRRLIKKLVTNESVDSEEETPEAQYFGDFRKFVKTQSEFSYKDGYTCLQVPCKLCCYRKDNRAPASVNDDVKDPTLWAYVNKRTGAFFCPPCGVRVPLALAQRIYEDSSNEGTMRIPMKAAEPEFTMHLNAKTRRKPTNETLEKLSIKDLKLADLELLDAFYDEVQQTLHFPLRNVIKSVVGELKWDLEKGCVETSPTHNCSGLLIHEPTTQTNSGSNCRAAVLVATLQDFLALISQRLEGCKCQ